MGRKVNQEGSRERRERGSKGRGGEDQKERRGTMLEEDGEGGLARWLSS